jgi:probable F420-dependent oxidoreductase
VAGPAKLAITLGMLNPRRFLDAVVAADRLGYDTVFMSDHLVFPVRVTDRLSHGAPPPPSATPVLDPLVYLGFLAGQTSQVRLGTFVYLLGLRHPFASARAFATLDLASQGRVIVGVGAGWLTSEWEAAGIDPARRGSRLDEAVGVCRRLWTEPEVAHDGPHFPFEPVNFEPKPWRVGGPPVMVGGESERALHRAARIGDGWLGMRHTPDSARQVVTRLGDLRAHLGRSGPFEVTVIGDVTDAGDLEEWADAGVHRVVVAPWTSSRDAVAAMESLADRTGIRR